jgi:glycosyltransferase involved in cell wall biosynthesis
MTTSPTPLVPDLVSVVTPFYNAMPYLAEAIESVRTQIYPHWEMVLADDGSDDGGSAIAKEYAARDPQRFVYVEHAGHARRGLPATRNLALAHGRGEFIALLDADDLWLPHKLAEHVAMLRAQAETQWLYGRSEYFHQDGRPAYLPEEAPPGQYLPPRLIKLNLPLGTFSPPTPSSLMFRRAVIDQIGAFEESFTYPHLHYFEDQAFLAKLYLNFPGTVVDRCYTRYRVHPQTITAGTVKAGQAHTARRFYFDWLRQYLRSQNIEDAQIWRLIDRRSWRDRHPLLWAAGYPARRLMRWLRG